MAKKPYTPGQTSDTITGRPLRPLFRLIPVTIIMASGLLTLKVIEIIESGRQLREELFVSTVAAEDKKEEPAKEAPPPDATQTDKQPDKPTEETAEDTTAEGEHKSAPAETPPPAAPPKDFTERNPSPFTQREVDVLEKLAERREKLDSWEKEIALREKVLEATEARIDQKMVEMEALNKKLEESLTAYRQEEDTKIKSLVKIYESMKPKEAAKIFEELDMNILLLVVDRMSERRVAPILANMSARKAKEVTEELAEQRKLGGTAASDVPGTEDISPPGF